MKKVKERYKIKYKIFFKGWKMKEYNMKPLKKKVIIYEKLKNLNWILVSSIFITIELMIMMKVVIKKTILRTLLSGINWDLLLESTWQALEQEICFPLICSFIENMTFFFVAHS